ncbi:Aminoacylase-1A [Zancudomyces culisetae]|uniref:Aminoacylase-1A n=1 Tax=Zancudomyces culisetae TaxID=1213189 RepID=A0A1R1PLA9_ZANCU|nr:Aminoacylase-1A [Zancudomyces culisetae]|eukprot:OMH81727.1 Aminoacylase-1A [Zancudomyces culisetae]
MEPESVQRFRKYLQIKTVHPTPDYENCAKFLLEQAAEIGLQGRVHELVKGKPIVILTWVGSNPDLKSVILNSHTDVVPIFEEFWDYPAFDAVRIPTGDGDYKIIARGSQDMKIVGSCYLEAIRNLKNAGKQPLRTIHLTFVPDEEINTSAGMQCYVHTEDFKSLNPAFVLDEGIANTGPELYAFYGERKINSVRFTSHGDTGHGSQFIQNTAISRIMNINNALLAFRDEEEKKLISQYGGSSQSTLGNVTTINLNVIGGGVQHNVVPENFSSVFDVRVSPNTDIQKLNAWFQQLADENHADLEFISKEPEICLTDVSKSNKFWCALLDVANNKGLKIIDAIFPAATDSRFIRGVGVQAIGISPLRNLPVLLHDHNEYVTESCFLEGVDFYTDLVLELANVEDH